jgi:hypothetical protein
MRRRMEKIMTASWYRSVEGVRGKVEGDNGDGFDDELTAWNMRG